LSEKLPNLSGKEIIKTLAKIGFVPVRQKAAMYSYGILMEDELLFPCIMK